jgi:hypothetical protein
MLNVTYTPFMLCVVAPKMTTWEKICLRQYNNRVHNGQNKPGIDLCTTKNWRSIGGLVR